MLQSVTPAQATETGPTNNPQQTQASIPESPPVIIEPRGKWVALDLRGLWSHRELLYFLMWRDLRVRYKQTVLGVAWVIIQPILLTVIFTVFLGGLARVPSDGVPYPLFVFVGLTGWNFFSGAVSTSSNSLVGNAHLITKVYFPRMIIPVATVGARLIDFAVSCLILFGLMAYYRVGFTANLLMLPALAAALTLLAVGAGTLLSALNVKYRDIGIALPVLIQLWMFVSPVVYPSTLVPAAWRGLYFLNPLAGLIDGLRSAFLGLAFNWEALGVSAAITLVLLVFAAYLFRRVEAGFADDI